MQVEQWPIGEEVWCDASDYDCIKDLPFYHQVPRGLNENIEYRVNLRKKAANDKGLQATLMEACAKDFLFWLSTFIFVFEPRPRPRVLPFVPWKHQEIFLMKMFEYLGRRDIGILKSRGEGASWCGMMLFLHQWIFDSMLGVGPAFGVASRNEDAVDRPKDPDSLFWKIDFALDKMPKWMVPHYNPQQDRSIGNHTFLNRKTLATIAGYSATGDVASGGRKSAFWLDECAKFLTVEQQDHAMNSLQHVTECRIICSTPKGDVGAFHDVMTRPSNMLKIVLHWTQNDLRKEGLYTSDNKKKKLEVLDKDFKWPEDYPFVLDGKKRSPWYDQQCSRPKATPQSIAQELDLDFGGSTYKFFGNAIEIGRSTVKPPVQIGEIAWDEEAQIASFSDFDKGNLKLWRKLKDGDFPPGSYVVGCDVASGTGGDFCSNSAMQIVDRFTGEQVAEWAHNKILPQDFAIMSVCVCRWIDSSPGASSFLVWDKLGPPGSQYTQAIMEQTNYRNFYVSSSKREEGALRGRGRKSKPGYHQQDRGKALGRIRDAIIRGALIIRSADTIRECNEWEFRSGTLVHIPSSVSLDESVKGAAHADRCMAIGMAWVGCVDRPLAAVKENPKKIPVGSMAWRMKRLDEMEGNRAFSEEWCWE